MKIYIAAFPASFSCKVIPEYSCPMFEGSSAFAISSMAVIASDELYPSLILCTPLIAILWYALKCVIVFAPTVFCMLATVLKGIISPLLFLTKKVEISFLLSRKDSSACINTL